MSELAGNMLAKQAIEQCKPGNNWQRPPNSTAGSFQHDNQQGRGNPDLEVPLKRAILIAQSGFVQSNIETSANACQGKHPTGRPLQYTPPFGACTNDQDPRQSKSHVNWTGKKVGNQSGENQSKMKGNKQNGEENHRQANGQALCLWGLHHRINLGLSWNCRVCLDPVF